MRYASNQTCQNKQGRRDLITCQKDSLIIVNLQALEWLGAIREDREKTLGAITCHCHSLSFTSGLQWSRRRYVNEAFVSKARHYWLSQKSWGRLRCGAAAPQPCTLAEQSHGPPPPSADAQTPQPSLWFYVPTSDYIFRLKKPNHWSTEAV